MDNEKFAPVENKTEDNEQAFVSEALKQNNTHKKPMADYDLKKVLKPEKLDI